MDQALYSYSSLRPPAYMQCAIHRARGSAAVYNTGYATIVAGAILGQLFQVPETALDVVQRVGRAIMLDDVPLGAGLSARRKNIRPGHDALADHGHILVLAAGHILDVQQRHAS